MGASIGRPASSGHTAAGQYLTVANRTRTDKTAQKKANEFG